MNYNYRHILGSAKLYLVWLVTLAGAVTSQMFNQLANTQMVHLKVLN